MVDIVADLSKVTSGDSRHDFILRTLNDEIDQGSLEISADPRTPRRAVIRTSDRISFKNCRRRWGWSSHLRHNLGPIQLANPLWFGSGMHFALEDFHGYNRFGHPKTAFLEYVRATKEHMPKKVPDDIEDLTKLGEGMMDYYIVWLQQRKNSLLKTFWFNGEPQVEVNFRFKIPFDASKWGYDEVVYSGTIDRVTLDDSDMIWINDYKSAMSIQTLHYATDPQVGVYMWAAPYIYDKQVGGFIYQQHRKSLPNPGRILSKGGVSVAQDQLTTRVLYKQTLIQVYGSVEASPPQNVEFLNRLAQEETEEYDKFVRIDKIYRNAHSAMAEGVKIVLEAEDMLNPDLPMYPNPTRECATFCPFHSPCVAMDDGSDWKHILDMTMQEREPMYDSWRSKIRYPEDAPPVFDDSWLNTDDEEQASTTEE